MDLTEVADELYGVRLEDFVASRNQKAKELRSDGEKELAATVAKLAKPSVSAWAVNMLARHADDEVRHVLDLGAALQEAQRSLDGAELRDLAGQRQALIAAVVRRARDIAGEHGHPIGDAVAEEVEQTLRAAMADAEAASAVQAGRLTAAIPPSGRGPLDLPAGAAATSSPSRSETAPATGGPKVKASKGDDDERARRHVQARRKADSADRAGAQADEQLAALVERVEEADRRKAALRMEIADLEARLKESERELAKVEADLEKAVRARDEAHRSAAAGRQTAAQARKTVSDLT